MLALALVGCGGDDADDDDDTPDAAVDAPGDQPDGGDVPDGGGPDAPTTGTASVHVIDPATGLPAPGLTVVFHDPAGAPTELLETDAEGRASSTVTAGSLVTLAVGGGSDFTLMTVADVQPGDDILFGPRVPRPPWQEAGQVTVNLPFQHAGASSYTVDLGCTAASGWPPTSLTLTIATTCLDGGGQISAVAYAEGDSGDWLAYSTALDQALVGTPPSMTATVNMPAWRTDFQHVPVHLQNTPPGTIGVGVGATVFHDGIEFDVRTGGFQMIEPGMSVSDDAMFAGGVASSFALSVQTMYGSGLAGDGLSLFLVRGAAIPPDVTIDLTATSLPRLAAPEVVPAGANPQVTWSGPSLDGLADAGVIGLRWNDGGTTWHEWQVLLPPGAVSPFVFPTLPAALAPWSPAAGSVYSAPQVLFVEADYIPDWDTMRNDYGPYYFEDEPDEPEMVVRVTAAMIID